MKLNVDKESNLFCLQTALVDIGMNSVTVVWHSFDVLESPMALRLSCAGRTVLAVLVLFAVGLMILLANTDNFNVSV